jgi:sodium pump decarboxylase gamma subunit
VINLGEYITIGDSLIITVFSMIVVFIVLIGISYLIDLLRVTTNGKEEEAKNTVVKENKTLKEVPIDANLDDKELVAVIAAAVAASMGVGITDINIKSINRISPFEPIWAETGRREYISGKL